MKMIRSLAACGGSALVSTLLVIVVLTIIVTAFLQSMTIEQQTARSYMNRYRAELAANAGANAAMRQVADHISKYPDSVTAWDRNIADGGVNLPGTVLYFYDTASVKQTSGPLPLPNFLPLTSGASAQPFAGPGNRGSSLDLSNGTVNINVDNLGFGEGPWIGKFPSKSETAAVDSESKIEIPWVLLKDDSSGNEKIVGRFAYWVEDESFRVNVNTSGTTRRGENTRGEKPSEIPLQGIIEAGSGANGEGESFASEVSSIRSDLDRVPSIPSLFQALDGEPLDSSTLKLLTSLDSTGSNLQRTGKRRTDLNALVTGSGSRAGPVESIVQNIDESAPGFGQRFWSGASESSVPESDADTYVRRIAANIADYIDSDSNPTLFDQAHALYAEGPPAFAIGTPGGPNDYPVFGKEAVPRIQETLMRVQQFGQMGGVGANTSPYEIHISYFVELWNPTTKEITVDDLSSSPGANDAYLLIANQASWEDAGTAPNKEPPFTPPDVKILLSEFRTSKGTPLVFPPGGTVVLSNDEDASLLVGPTGAHIFKSQEELDTVYFAQGREFSKSGTLRSNNRSGYGGRPTLQMITRTRPPGQPTDNPPAQDNDTEIVLGNDLGYLESHAQALPISPGIFLDSFGNKSNRSFFHLRGGILKGNREGSPAGNRAPDQFGDAVANVEPLYFDTEGSDANPLTTNPSSFWNIRGIKDKSLMGQSAIDSFQTSSLGKPNTDFVDSSKWPEGIAESIQTLENGGAPYVIADRNLRSIGELGNLFDPRRSRESSYAQGGARTLRIGQPEEQIDTSIPTDIFHEVWDGEPTSISRNRVAWRLTDIFGIRDEPAIEGLVNINGSLRDNGLALRTALSGFKFLIDSETGDLRRSGKELSEQDLDNLVLSLNERLKEDAPPLLERGEISELDFFGNGTAAENTQNSVADRGREEIFRRLIELICTRGTTFSVYAIGQAVTERSDGSLRVLSTSARKVTFRLVPKGTDGLSGYDLQILSTTL